MKWKLRNADGKEFPLSPGENLVGRGVGNTISIQDCVVSRNHTRIEVEKDGQVTVEDLKSSNGTFVGSLRIPEYTQYPVVNNEIVGFGWTEGHTLPPHRDLVYRLINISQNDTIIDLSLEEDEDIPPSKKQRFESPSTQGEGSTSKHYICKTVAENMVKSDQSEINQDLRNQDVTTHPSKMPDIEQKMNSIFHSPSLLNETLSTDNKPNLRGNTVKTSIRTENISPSLKSQSQNDTSSKPHKSVLKEEEASTSDEEIQGIKTECVYDEELNFSMKEEYLDEEPILIDSDSEDDTWFVRLSQSSPGKPYLKRDMSSDDNEETVDGIQIAPFDEVDTPKAIIEPMRVTSIPSDEEEDFVEDIIRLPGIYDQMNLDDPACKKKSEKEVQEQNCSSIKITKTKDGREGSKVESKGKTATNNEGRKAVMISPISASLMRRHAHIRDDIKKKGKGVEKKRTKSYIPSPPKLRLSQKEERNRRLKEIAEKAKLDTEASTSKQSSHKAKAKVTSSNRGAFLAEDTADKPVSRKDKGKKKSDKMPNKCKGTDEGNKTKHNRRDSLPSDLHSAVSLDEPVSCEKSLGEIDGDPHSPVSLDEPVSWEKSLAEIDRALYLKSGKKGTKNGAGSTPLVEMSSKERTQPAGLSTITKEEAKLKSKSKPKKKVRFSTELTQVKYFEIEPGHQMKKTSMCKAIFLNQQRSLVPALSSEKRFLMKVLKWNVSWLEEQQKKTEPPPILPHAGDPMSMCHVFSSYDQYVHILTDLILLETWASISQAYSFKRNQENWLRLVVDSLPLDGAANEAAVPLTLSVNLTLPKSDRRIPRVGEIMIMCFGSEQEQIKKFVYVHNIRTLPAPANNVNNFFTLWLYCLRTEKMKTLKPGAVVMGKCLGSLRNELVLIEAIEELKSSLLGPVVLNPKPEHFSSPTLVPPRCKWTVDLNPSQVLAVETSVAAALGDQPSIQMIQGPPGTGKSCVICTMVMRYFYTLDGRRQRNRDKVLICATSNTAVDELVLRLLKFRQELPSEERFRMVRVGREESMHPRAQHISSATLAKRDVLSARQAAQRTGHAQPDFSEEIANLEMRVSTYRGSLQASLSNPARAAYLQQRLQYYTQRLHQVKAATGNLASEPTPGELAAAERRIIEGANIIVTTLSSAANQKLKCLKNHIELCIVDEAGQAIEPVTLVPLLLGVRKLTLIGDPKQLPGHTTSQRAKEFGLGESLFSRLSSAAEVWPQSPVVLLNEQYRMHPAIADYPNRAFYDGQVLDRARPRTDLPLPPYAMLFISSGNNGQSASGANEMEAWGVARLALELSALVRPRALSLAVITPYHAHKDMILKCLAGLVDLKEQPIEVNTVDSFQGQERDVVVVSVARSQGVGFLHDAGRMNVMLTRAKHALFICLNPHAVMKHNQWRTLVEDAKKRSAYKYLPNDVCQPTTAKLAMKNPILKIIGDLSNRR